uniref:CSON001563 protein n=1 Tax=Culicoides sonorensis TaxID=179676 RepID=A0A336K6J8_CULSO
MHKSLFLLINLSIFQSISSHALPTRRIYGGTPAEPGQFPFQVSLRKETGDHFCGGAILSESWIITCAHCLPSITVQELKIVYGTMYYHGTEQLHSVSKIIVHQEWTHVHDTHSDIGLIQLEKPIVFNVLKRPIKIYTDQVKPGDEAVIFRGDMNNGSRPIILQHLKVTIISFDQCAEYKSDVKDTNICTQSPEGFGICFADSGGPLTKNDKLLGLASFTTRFDCANGAPDGYLRVSDFISWIQITDETPVRRIWGGNVAKSEYFRYQVSLRGIPGRKSNKHSCGGAILSKSWIITCAHCLQYFTPKTLRVVYGTIYNYGNETLHEVSKIIQHHEYKNDRQVHSDIGLVKLRYPIIFGKFVQPIEIYTEFVKEGDQATVSGW